jgi:hypothetical protein
MRLPIAFCYRVCALVPGITSYSVTLDFSDRRLALRVIRDEHARRSDLHFISR